MEHEPTMQQQQQKLQIESSFVIPHESVSRNSLGLECKAAVFWLLKQPFFLVFFPQQHPIFAYFGLFFRGFLQVAVSFFCAAANPLNERR